MHPNTIDLVVNHASEGQVKNVLSLVPGSDIGVDFNGNPTVRGLVALTGANAAPTVIKPRLTPVRAVDITTDAAGGVNDFDLFEPAGLGDTLLIRLKTKNTQNATITEGTATTIVTNSGGDVASITLDAAGEFVVLVAVAPAVWAILSTNGTVA